MYVLLITNSLQMSWQMTDIEIDQTLTTPSWFSRKKTVKRLLQ